MMYEIGLSIELDGNFKKFDKLFNSDGIRFFIHSEGECIEVTASNYYFKNLNLEQGKRFEIYVDVCVNSETSIIGCDCVIENNSSIKVVNCVINNINIK